MRPAPGRRLLSEEISDPCAGRAGENGVLEGLWSSPASWAGRVRVLVEPRGEGSQVALCCSHLVDPSCHKLSQPYEGVVGERGGVFLVRVRGVVGSPVLGEHVLSAGPEGLVGLPHEVWRRNLRSAWGRGL